MTRYLINFLGIFLFITSSLLFTSGTSSAQNVGDEMTIAATEFLASLDQPAQLGVAKMRFDDPARMDWHNIPKATRKGLQFRDMSAEQRDRCLGLLKTALSESGFQQAMNIMALEINLKVGETNKPSAHLRDHERFYLTIFGEPGNQGIWGWSFEGHHLSLNFVLRDGEVVSCTPLFMGANPATVKTFVAGGPRVGTRTLAAEEQLGFDLLNALDETQLKIALIDTRSPADYRFAGLSKVPASQTQGLAGELMNELQKESLMVLLETYFHRLTPDLARKNLETVEAQGLERIHFSWAGSTIQGVGHYYRIEGPSILIEFVNNQTDPEGNAANHIHTILRDPINDFGR